MHYRLHLVLSAAALALAAPAAAQTADVDRIESQAASRAAMQQSWRAERQAMQAQRDAGRAQATPDAPRAQREAVGSARAAAQTQREAFRAQRATAAEQRAAGAGDWAAQREALRVQRDADAAQRGVGVADWRAQREAVRAQRAAQEQVRTAQADAGLPAAGPERDAELQRRGAEFRERYRRSQVARTADGRAAGVTPDPRVPADVLTQGVTQGGDGRDLRGERVDGRDRRSDGYGDGYGDRIERGSDWRTDRRDDRDGWRGDGRDARRDWSGNRRDRRWNDAWAQRGWDQRWAQQRYDRYGRPFDWNRGRRYVWGYNLDPRFGFGSQWAWDPFWSYDPSWWGSYGYYDGSRFRDGYGYGVRAEDLVRSDPIIGRWALIRHDRDRSGWLGPSETLEAARDLRRFADLNGDGRISDREYRIALDRLQQLADRGYGNGYGVNGYDRDDRDDRYDRYDRD